jgi:hypothetical protein
VNFLRCRQPVALELLNSASAPLTYASPIDGQGKIAKEKLLIPNVEKFPKEEHMNQTEWSADYLTWLSLLEQHADEEVVKRFRVLHYEQLIKERNFSEMFPAL